MKTIVAITALTMMSGLAVADWEDVWQNPDLDPKYGSGFDIEFSPVAPTGTTVTALDAFYRDNPDVSVGVFAASRADQIGQASRVATSLEVVTMHNPDQYDGMEMGTVADVPTGGVYGIGDSTPRF